MGTRKQFLSSLGLLLLLNLMIKPLYVLCIETGVQNVVGPEVFGIYSAILSVTFLLNIFLDAGITNFNTRNIAQHQQLLQKHFSGIISLRLFLGVIYFIALFIAGYFLQYVQSHLFIFILLGINQFLVSGILYLRSNLAGLMLFKRDALVSTLDRFILLISMGTLLLFPGYFGEFKIEWLVIGQTYAYGIAFLVAFAMVSHRMEKTSFQWNLPFAKMILKKSLPFALLILLSMAYYKTDAVMLEQLLDNGDFHAGIYAMGFRFFEASNMIGFLFAGLLLPLFSRLFKEESSIESIAQSAFQLLFTGGFVLALFCLLIGENLLDLFYTQHVDLAVMPFKLLMCAFFFVMLTYLFGTILTAKGELKWLNKMALLGVVLNVGLNYFLIQSHQAVGSALASLITQGLVAIIQIILVMKVTGIRFQSSTIRSLLLFTSMCGGVFYFFTIIELNWLLEGGLFLFSCAGFALLSKFVHLGQFKELFQS
ncbi:MAG: oligosaccharide flippase family protein [Flavobacteriales bacterium]